MTGPDRTLPGQRRGRAAPSGAATEAGNAAPTPEVRAMFDRISGVYDPMNLAISAFQEPYLAAPPRAGDRAATGDAGARRGVRDRQGGGRPHKRVRARRPRCSEWTSRPG